MQNEKFCPKMSLSRQIKATRECECECDEGFMFGTSMQIKGDNYPNQD